HRRRGTLPETHTADIQPRGWPIGGGSDVAELSYRMLGALLVSRGEDAVALRAVKPRRLLGTLLLYPNRFVSTDLILDVLWARPPRSAVANVRTYVRALRGVLGGAIETHPGGYGMSVDGDALDATRLERLVADGARLGKAGDRPGALRAYEEARGLWRGR